MVKFKGVIFIFLMVEALTVQAQFLPNVPNTPRLPPRTGNQVSLSSSYYSYNEPDASISHTGVVLGIGYERTQQISNSTFIRANIDYNKGSLDYAGTGTKTGVPQSSWDGRLVIGTNYQANDETLSPYIGLGYRTLYNDNRGPSSTGAAGYQRTVSYTYIPLGILSRKITNGNALLETRLEYDYLLRGRAQSQLTDVIGSNGITDTQDVNNTQSSGWGLRLSVAYLKDNWGVTPYLNYWFIQNSDAVPITVTQNGVTSQYLAIEPTNRTNEYGVKVSYDF